MIIRPIRYQDLHALLAIAKESGPGFTSLMDDADLLQRKIQHSLDSFGRSVTHPVDEHYLFVLVDEDSGEIMGTTAIEAAVGHERPLFHFQRSPIPNAGRETGPQEQLTRCNHYTGCSEICSLFLRPAYRTAAYRRTHAGKLLSKVRFLFMAQHRNRFARTVIAEMRGVSDERGQSPFWNWLRIHGANLDGNPDSNLDGNLDFATVTRLAGTSDRELLDTLLPAGSLCTTTMTRKARQVIGQVHPQTRPALKLLTDEGFHDTGFVDLFDAGPTVEAPLEQITSVQRSCSCTVQVVDDNMPAITRNQPGNYDQALLLTNTGTHEFRATVTRGATWLPHHQLLTVPRALAAKLKLESGSPARFVPLAPAETQAVPCVDTPPTEAHYAH